LKVVLVEQKRTGKWLAEKLDKNEATVSQLSLETLFAIAKALNVDAKELLVSTKK
jgi:hypothetical protein